MVWTGVLLLYETLYTPATPVSDPELDIWSSTCTFEEMPVPLRVIVEPGRNIPFPTGVPLTVRIEKLLLGTDTLLIVVPGKIPAIPLSDKVNEVPVTTGLLIVYDAPFTVNAMPEYTVPSEVPEKVDVPKPAEKLRDDK
jgi:hypothetical protein